MRLKEYSEKLGISYRTAWNWFNRGEIVGAYRMPSGVIIIPEKEQKKDYVVIYARVSSSTNKDNLNTQAKRLVGYAEANGYVIEEVIKEVGSGINDKRKRLENLLENDKVTKIIVEHKDRLTRVGFNYIEILLKRVDCEIEVVNRAEEEKTDLIEDLIAIITSFCSRYYGMRRGKRKTEKIIEELTHDKEV